MLIVHIITTPDTEQFAHMYDGLIFKEDVTLLTNPQKTVLKTAIQAEKQMIVFIGHGTENGLLNAKMNDYLVDHSLIQLLRGKNIVGIWCNASTFASKYGLTGFFTSMFISNEDELLDCGFELYNGCIPEIYNQNRLFAYRINDLLHSQIELKYWADKLRAQVKSKHKFVHYNYEAMCSLINGE